MTGLEELRANPYYPLQTLKLKVMARVFARRFAKRCAGPEQGFPTPDDLRAPERRVS